MSWVDLTDQRRLRSRGSSCYRELQENVSGLIFERELAEQDRKMRF